MCTTEAVALFSQSSDGKHGSKLTTFKSGAMFIIAFDPYLHDIKTLGVWIYLSPCLPPGYIGHICTVMCLFNRGPMCRKSSVKPGA